jgi:anti-anti-sigma factor
MALSPDITQLPWNLVEECGDQAIAKLKECRASTLLVDLTSLDYLGSAQVALLARIWKVLAAQNGTMSVQTNSPVVREVIRTAGLHRLWSLVESQEQGLEKLGINDTGVRVVPTRWTIGPGVTAIASLLLSALAWKGPADWRFWAGCAATLLGSLAVFLSRRAIAKAEQGQRALGVLSLLVGLGSVATGAFFMWPRSDLDARIFDPEKAAGVYVDDPERFAEPVEVPPENSPATTTDPPSSSPIPPSLENQPQPVPPANPAARSESAPRTESTPTKQPASATESPITPTAVFDADPSKPVSQDTKPDAAPVDQNERPEAPSEPLDATDSP